MVTPKTCDILPQRGFICHFLALFHWPSFCLKCWMYLLQFEASGLVLSWLTIPPNYSWFWDNANMCLKLSMSVSSTPVLNACFTIESTTTQWRWLEFCYVMKASQRISLIAIFKAMYLSLDNLYTICLPIWNTFFFSEDIIPLKKSADSMFCELSRMVLKLLLMDFKCHFVLLWWQHVSENLRLWLMSKTLMGKPCVSVFLRRNLWPWKKKKS